MANDLTFTTTVATVPSGTVVATDDVGGVHYPYGKVAWGADDTATPVTLTDGFPVQPGTSTVWPVSDNSGSLTVDAPVGTPVFVRLSDGAAAITTLPVSLASVPSHDVTNAGTFAVQAAQSGTWNVGTVTAVTTVSTITNVVHVDDNSSSLTVDNGGTFVVQENGAALTSLQLIDDCVVADDAAFTPATTKVMMAGFEYDDTTPDTVNEGDAGAARMSSRREVYVQLRDAAGNERGLNIDASGYATVNINGTVTVGSHAVTNAGTFAVQAQQESNTVSSAGSALTVKFAAIAAASSGNNTLVAAVTSKKIRVLSLNIVCASAVSVYATSAAAGTVIWGGSTNKMAYGANGGIVLPENPRGWFETVAGEALILNLSSAVAVSGSLSYIEV